MEDILEKVKKLQEIGALAYVSPKDAPEGGTLSDTLQHLHIEAQTYLLAEILTELRKVNKLQILKKDIDFSYEKPAFLPYDRKESQNDTSNG